MTRGISINAIPAAAIHTYSSITGSAPVNFAFDRLKQIIYSTLPGESQLNPKLSNGTLIVFDAL